MNQYNQHVMQLIYCASKSFGIYDNTCVYDANTQRCYVRTHVCGSIMWAIFLPTHCFGKFSKIINRGLMYDKLETAYPICIDNYKQSLILQEHAPKFEPLRKLLCGDLTKIIENYHADLLITDAKTPMNIEAVREIFRLDRKIDLERCNVIYDEITARGNNICAVRFDVNVTTSITVTMQGGVPRQCVIHNIDGLFSTEREQLAMYLMINATGCELL